MLGQTLKPVTCLGHGLKDNAKNSHIKKPERDEIVCSAGAESEKSLLLFQTSGKTLQASAMLLCSTIEGKQVESLAQGISQLQNSLQKK